MATFHQLGLTKVRARSSEGFLRSAPSRFPNFARAATNHPRGSSAVDAASSAFEGLNFVFR
ncbi:hypothetical protein D9M68_387660 [compost metagenome]